MTTKANLDVDQSGLTSAEVRQRVADGKSNDVPVSSSRTLGEIVRSNVLTPFNAILGGLFFVVAIVGPIKQGLFGVIILANTLIGIVQELRAKRTLDRLAVVGEARPRAWRDGDVVEISPREVVLDDLLELAAGDKIVVDGEARAADGLEVDESLLTGESDPVLKAVGDSVLSGSFVAAGYGAYQASKVGKDAYAAKLAADASRFTLVRSELRNGINRILTVTVWLLIPVGALTIYNQLNSDEELPSALRGMVAALVPMVPEGLVLLTSIAFAVGVVRLGRRQCLVQELPAIEGLARVDVVCADKTGTLTENGMRVAEVRHLTDGPAGSDTERALAALAGVDPRPNASLRAIAEAYPGGAPDWASTATVPFSSARKWSGASFAEHGDWVLGAPDVLLPAGHPAVVEAERAGAAGLRVLLLGRTDTKLSTVDGTPRDVTPLALVVLEQRIRTDAEQTLRYFADQDVAVKVISGDNARSVAGVARGLGLSGSDRPVDARELPAGSEQLATTVDSGVVFGRVTPAQKRAMVGALQSRGHTVAMTGDGVNDVLALKDADIGVAMGSGSPATRAVAQIVLLDDKFATLPHVVAEGRRVIGNVERVANLFLVKTVYSVLLALLIGLAGIPFPLDPLHLTLIGALTIGAPAFFLALAPNTERARPGFVARVMRMSVPVGTIAAAATFLTYWLLRRSDPSGTALQHRTATVLTLAAVAFWALVVIARPYRLWKIGLLVAMVGGFLVALYLPMAQRFFELDPTNHTAMLTALGFAGVAVILVEISWWADGWLRQEKRRRTEQSPG